MFQAVIGSQLPHQSHHSLSSGHFTIPSRSTSPFLGSFSMASSPFVTGSSLAPSTNTLPKRQDYPKVKFWYRRDWSTFKGANNSTEIGVEPVRGKTLMSKGINKNAKYIEDADGVPVDGYKLRDILAHARSVWESLKTIRRAPLSWGKADAEVAQRYHHEVTVMKCVRSSLSLNYVKTTGKLTNLLLTIILPGTIPISRATSKSKRKRSLQSHLA